MFVFLDVYSCLHKCPFSYPFQVDELIASIEKIDIEVRSLESCAYNRETFDEILGKVQKAVDDLNLHSYSNLSSWVKSLDEEVCFS